MDLVTIAQTTLDAFDHGSYTNPAGKTVTLTPALEACLTGTRLYAPDELAVMEKEVTASPGQLATTFAVTHETSLEGAARLVASGECARVGVLNFASARHPGGGFLRGARAQEESLARSSGLYYSLLRCPEYYDFHRAQKTCLYSDHIIYSPACPVIRNDADGWLDAPYAVDFITSAAPNKRAILDNEPDQARHIPATFEGRAGKVLALAARMGCEALVLGAWGCGAFRNDPEVVARVFHDHLRPVGGAYAGRFRHILFAVHGRSGPQENFHAFARRFPESV